jgi:NAD(P)-dependent dehydrogenase (short-subunit alcohol dehydrogenase family)
MTNLFDLTGKVAIITGGAGLLGQQHVAAIAEAGGTFVAVDNTFKEYFKQIHYNGMFAHCDVTDDNNIEWLLENVIEQYDHIDILINNAAINSETGNSLRFEEMILGDWERELEVGLTGAFLCSQIIGGHMAAHGGGVIVNIGSDFAHLAPNPAHYAPKVKPASYSVVKHGLLGLTRYLAAYWGDKGVRVNMLSPGGVENGQPAEFVKTIAAQNPLGRMACADEYRGAIQFLCSDASKYMTGAELIMDGGRSIW